MGSDWIKELVISMWFTNHSVDRNAGELADSIRSEIGRRKPSKYNLASGSKGKSLVAELAYNQGITNYDKALGLEE